MVLFDAAHKKPLPAYPECIGVVTSKTGAALQDIRNVISRRWPSVRLLLCPVTVQGFEAARQIAAAIRTLDQSGKVDEIIVARGGGSREDLWARDRLHHSGLCSRPACSHAVRCRRACGAGSGGTAAHF